MSNKFGPLINKHKSNNTDQEEEGGRCLIGIPKGRNLTLTILTASIQEGRGIMPGRTVSNSLFTLRHHNFGHFEIMMVFCVQME